MSSDDNMGGGRAGEVDSSADTVATSAEPGREQAVQSTMMAPTAVSDECVSGEAVGEISASFPVADRGRYDVKGEHARGGLGRILQAHDRRLNRSVAIKELLRAGEGAEARFLREAVVTARLEHPSIVPVHDMGRWSSGAPFYAMKMVSGDSLEQRIAASDTIADRLALVSNLVAVVDAMAYAHSKGVIHRDLKPSNVVVGPFGETIVIDWGLAKDRELADELNTLEPGLQAVADGLTMVGSVMGTPAYMPPEQALGEPVDERADIYALGAMLYHLLCGQAPYSGDRSVRVLKQVTTGPPPAIDPTTSGAPVELIAICDKAMARSPDDRYQSATALVADLKRFQMGQLVSVYTYSTWSHVRRWLGRYRAPVAVAGVGMMVLAVMAVISVRRIVTEKRAAQQQHAVANKQREAADRQRVISERRTVALLEEQGRRELLADRPLRALVYLSRAYSAGSDTPRIRSLIRDGMRQVDGRYAALGHGGKRINDLVWSPDGTLLVTASADGRVTVWDVAGKREIGQLIGHQKAVTRLSFSADSKRILTAGKDGSARIWDARTLRSLRVLDAHKDGVQNAHFSPTGDGFVTGGNDWTAKLWTNSGAIAHTLRTSGPIVQGASFDASGKQVLTVGMNTAQLWDVATGKLKHTFSGHQQAIFHAVMSADGKRIVTTSFDKTSRLWDAKTGKLVTTLRAKGAVQHAVFSPDSSVLVTVGRKQHAVMWDAGSGDKLKSLAHPQAVWEVTYSADGKQLATVCSDGAARLWDATTGGLIARLPGHRKVARHVRFSSDGKLLATAGDDGMTMLWKTHGWKLRMTIASPAGQVRFDPAGVRLVTTGRDGFARLWDATTFAPTVVFDGRPKQPVGNARWSSTMTPKQARRAMDNMFRQRSLVIRDAFFSPDGKRAVTLSGDPTVRVWDPVTGDLIHRLFRHRGTVTAAVFSPDSRFVASASADATVVIWDVVRGKMVRQLRPGPKHRIATVVFSPDGTRLASAGLDKLVRIWDVATGKVLRTFDGHTKTIYSLRYSPDGKFLLSASADATAKLWQVATGALMTTLRHGKNVVSAGFSSNGKLIVTGSFDRTAKVWSARTGTLLVSFDGHTNTVLRALFSPDDTMVATISRDGTAKIWDAQGGQLLATLQGHNAAVSAIAFHPRGHLIVTVSSDGAAVVWDVGRESRTAKQIAAMVSRASPWRLHQGRLMPKD